MLEFLIGVLVGYILCGVLTANGRDEKVMNERMQQDEKCEYCGYYAVGRRHLIGYGDGNYIEVEVHYCPHCGRRLEERSKDND